MCVRNANESLINRSLYKQLCSGLPKTRSGKIMRRILRKVAADQTDDLGDITTLADPSVVASLVENHKRLAGPV